jgi:hypothetical protein
LTPGAALPGPTWQLMVRMSLTAAILSRHGQPVIVARYLKGVAEGGLNLIGEEAKASSPGACGQRLRARALRRCQDAQGMLHFCID